MSTQRRDRTVSPPVHNYTERGYYGVAVAPHYRDEFTFERSMMREPYALIYSDVEENRHGQMSHYNILRKWASAYVA